MANKIPGVRRPLSLETPRHPADDLSRQAARGRAATKEHAAHLLWWEPVWLLCLGPSILFPGRFWVLDWQPALVLLCWLFWPLRRWVVGRWTVDVPLLRLPLWLLLVCLPVSLLVSIEPLRSWSAIGPLVWGSALFVALSGWPVTRRRPAVLGNLLVLGGTSLALLLPLLLRGAPSAKFFALPRDLPTWGYLTQTTAESVNPNVLAGVLVVFWPLAAAFVVARGVPWWWRLAYLLPGLLMLAGLAATQSRGAYFAATVALLVLLGGRWPRLGLSLGLMGGAVLLSFLLPGAGVDSVRFFQNALDQGVARVALWERALWAWRDFPLTGIGFGLFDPVIFRLYPYVDSGFGRQPHAHNLLLQIGLDLGLPGLAAMLALWTGCLILALRQTRRPASSGSLVPVWAWGATGGLVAMLAHGLVDAVTWGTKISPAPWLLMALIVCGTVHHDAADAGMNQERIDAN